MIKALFVFSIAVFLAVVLIPISWIFTMIYVLCKSGWKDSNKPLISYLKDCSIGLDQTGNCYCQYPFNLILIKPDGYPHGNADENVSSVLGVNQLAGKLTKTGRFIVRFLAWAWEEPNHCIDSIDPDIKRPFPYNKY